jgi:hypothetical protein
VTFWDLCKVAAPLWSRRPNCSGFGCSDSGIAISKVVQNAVGSRHSGRNFMSLGPPLSVETRGAPLSVARMAKGM